MRPLLRLAWPVFVEEILNLLVGYTDWYLAGHYLKGAEYPAAMGLLAYSMWLVLSFFSAVSIGAMALTARSVGAGQMGTARHVVGQAVFVGAVLAIVASSGVFLLAPTFTRIMQLEPQAADLAVRYLWVIAPAIPLIMLEQVGIACLRAAGDTVTGLVVKVLVNIVNVSLSAGLLLGLGTLPQLGWEGLAVGTAAGHGLAGVIITLLLVRGRAGLKLERRNLVPDWPLIRRILRVGVPGAADVLGVITCHLAYVSIINRLGTLAAAAHGLAIQVEALAYLPGSAFQVSTATMTGQLLGAGQPERATRSALTALALGEAFLCTAGVILFFFGGRIAAIFTGDVHNPTSQLAGKLLPIVALGMPLFAMLSIFAGALRGAGDTRVPLLITFTGLIGVRIPLAAWLAYEQIELSWLGMTIEGWNLGVQGAWVAMVLDIFVRSTLLSVRFFTGGWKRVKV